VERPRPAVTTGTFKETSIPCHPMVGCVGSDERMAYELEECYAKHGDALLRFAASQVGVSDADDVLSAAVLGVLRHTGEIADIRSYLYRAVANASRKHWRSRRRRQHRETFLVPVPEGTTTECQDPWIDVILGALNLLSVQQRAVLHLTYWEDLTPGVVAQRIGVSEGTVRRQLARARNRLRTVLDDGV
jgi:RNA polymerase sigma-70 factor, ECF subfamily